MEIACRGLIQRWFALLQFIMVGEHSLIILIEIVIFIAIVCICRGIPRVEISKRKFSLEWRRNRPSQDDISAGTSVKRRQSLDDLNINKTTKPQKRRPSEEALKIDGMFLAATFFRIKLAFIY